MQRARARSLCLALSVVISRITDITGQASSARRLNLAVINLCRARVDVIPMLTGECLKLAYHQIERGERGSHRWFGNTFSSAPAIGAIGWIRCHGGSLHQ